MRPNKNIPFNYNLSVAEWSSGTGVEVRDNRCPKADPAIVPDRYVLGMQLIDVHQLANPDIFTDGNSP